jgi:hypothetical protein
MRELRTKKNPHNPANRSQWNKFRNTYSDYKLFVKFNVIINTDKLSVFRIQNERLKRLELIYNLHIKGLSNKEISEYLNNKNLKTFRTNDIYTPKLIWMTLKKYNIRLLRKNENILQIRESLYVKPHNKF